MNSPYDGLKVLELEGAAGMYCGKMLSAWGAEVIKIERPGGDICRKAGPFAKTAAGEKISLTFEYFNTGKKSVTLDLSGSEGQMLFKELASCSDVIIESFAPGRMKKWGLDYEALKEISPGLIMLSITPFGQTGPHSAWKASTDLIVDAMGGPMAEVGIEGREPLHLGYDILSFMCGMYGLFAIQAAFHETEKSGVGAHIDLSQQECCLTWKNQALGFAQVDRKSPSLRKAGSVRQGLVNCKDGFAFAMVGGKWQETLAWFSDMGQDISVFDAPEYQRHAADMLTKWDAVLLDHYNTLGSNYTKTEMMLEGQKRKLAVGVVESPDSLLLNEHFNARGYFVDVFHPLLGKLKYPGEPAKMGKCRQTTDKPAPLPGEHNREIMERLRAARFDKPRGNN